MNTGVHAALGMGEDAGHRAAPGELHCVEVLRETPGVP